MRQVDWYFDFISPFAYLQFNQFGRLPADVRVRPVPVVFGALLKHWGHLGPAEIPPKRSFIYRQCKWHADRMGVPFRMPPHHPFNPLPALRLHVAAGATTAAAAVIWDRIWGQGLAVDTADDIAALGAALGIDDPAAAIADPAVKEALHRNTAAGIERGLFGVPTFADERHLFWGTDATGMFLDYLADPGLMDTPEMQAIGGMPMGVVRAKG